MLKKMMQRKVSKLCGGNWQPHLGFISHLPRIKFCGSPISNSTPRLGNPKPEQTTFKAENTILKIKSSFKHNTLKSNLI